MKIYFLASLNQKAEFKETYRNIVNYLNKNNNEVYEKVLSQYLPQADDVSAHKVEEWYKEWSEYVKECDFAIAEVSYPSSVQVGFEVAMILSRGKPVVLLHKNNRNPVFINNLYSSRLIKTEYNDDNLNEIIDWSMEEVDAISKKRFTFYITPELDDFLDKESSKSDISKSEIIRDLINKEKRKSS